MSMRCPGAPRTEASWKIKLYYMRDQDFEWRSGAFKYEKRQDISRGNLWDVVDEQAGNLHYSSESCRTGDVTV